MVGEYINQDYQDYVKYRFTPTITNDEPCPSVYCALRY